jgi:acid phosphatase (class A)
MPGGGGGGVPAFAMDETHPLTVDDTSPLRTDITEFPRGYWNADMLAQIGVIQFLAIEGWASEIEDNVPLFDPKMREEIFSPVNVNAEITVLKEHLAGKERMNRRDEILQQDQNFQLYWLQMMTFSRTSHPKTFFLLKVAARIAEVLMIHFKEKYKRPRPSQLCPALMPLLEVPGHASFPSGHSFISHLTSLCLTDLMPFAATSLAVLADRVAHNRELAGVHYPSDSLAGKQMAEVVHGMLPGCKIYSDTLDVAKTEWATASTGNGARRISPKHSAALRRSDRKDRPRAAR